MEGQPHRSLTEVVEQARALLAKSGVEERDERPAGALLEAVKMQWKVKERQRKGSGKAVEGLDRERQEARMSARDMLPPWLSTTVRCVRAAVGSISTLGGAPASAPASAQR